MTWVVVIRCGNVIIDVAGPFDSADAAHSWVWPKNVAQRGSVFGEVHYVSDRRDGGEVEREQARNINTEMRKAVLG